jgi:predicted transcriptional regulator
MSDKAKTSPPSLKVEAIMTSDVQGVHTEMTVRAAILMLTKFKVSGAPVVDSLGHVVSVVSEGDLLKLAATVGLDKPISFCLQKLVKVEKLITLKKTSSFSEAYTTFLSHPVHRIIIVDAAGKLQGIVTRSNILKALCSSDAQPEVNKAG